MVDVNSLGNLEKKLYYKILEIQAEFEKEDGSYVNSHSFLYAHRIDFR